MQEWAECIQDLDDAKRRDSKGDSADRVVNARAIAEREIAKQPKTVTRDGFTGWPS